MKNKRDNPRKGISIGRKILLLNSIVLILVVPLFVVYVLRTVRRDQITLLNNYNATAYSVMELVDSCIEREKELTKDIACYMQDSQLDKEGVITFLDYVKLGSGYLTIIDTNDCSGEMFYMDNKEGMVQERVSFQESDVIRELCTVYKAEKVNLEAPKKDIEIHTIDSFYSDIFGEEVVSFYGDIIWNGKHLLVIYNIGVEQLMAYIHENTVLASSGMMLDAKGNLMTEISSTEEDYRYILDRFHGQKLGTQVKSSMMQENYGTVCLSLPNKERLVYMYAKVQDTGWYYLNSLTDEHLAAMDVKWMAALGVFVFLFLPFLIDSICIGYQNRTIKKVIDQMAEKNELLYKANQAKDTFISNMSHEIRTPINAVIGMDEMIIRESSEEEIRNYAYDIQNSAGMLRSMINDILDLTRLESGSMMISEADYEIAMVVKELTAMTKAKMTNRPLELKVEADPEMPSLLYGDDRRIKQVILNLLTNAVKYTPSGQITFKMGYEKVSEEEIDLHVCVKDTGIGMKEEDLDKLTVRFERLEEGRNRDIEGTGIGLNIVSSILELMGSEIKVKSIYGVGSEFYFTLRQKVISWERMGEWDVRDNKNNPRKENKALFIARTANILIVDDMEININVAKGLLKRNCMNIDTATSGKQCIQMVEKKKYDLIILDHKMPEMDGVDTLKHLRLLKNGSVPVICLTANALAGGKSYYTNLGFDDYLTKPVRPEKLEQIVMQYLPKEKLEDNILVNEENGIKNCGSRELYLSIVEDFVTQSDAIRQELAGFLMNEDISGYTIKVHALKSSARLIGAQGLSDEAAYLEQCGEDSDMEQISKMTPALFESLKKVVNYLADTYGVTEVIEESSENRDVPMDEATFAAMLKEIKECNECFDFDGVEFVMDRMKECTMTQEHKEIYKKLSNAVFNVRQEEINDIISQFEQERGGL